MNFQKIYDDIIIKAIKDNRKKKKRNSINYIYYENHHIIPRCLCGSNKKENLVLLTAREHYICHKLLTYIYKNNYKLIAAFTFMSFNKKSKYKISSRDYSYARELCALNYGNYNSQNKKGQSYKNQMIKIYGEIEGIEKTIQYKKKISVNNKGNNNPMYGKGYLIKGDKNGMFGKISPMKNVKRSEESKLLMSNSKMGIKRKTHTCPYCFREIADGNFERWHGINVKIIKIYGENKKIIYDN